MLAREIRDKGLTNATLESYAAERLPVTARIVLANRGEGPDAVMEVVHQRARDGFERLEDVITRAEMEEIAAGYKKTAGMDIEALNAAPPIL